MKKLGMMVIAAVLLFTLALTACSSSGNNSGDKGAAPGTAAPSASGTAAAADSNLTPPGTYPIVKNKVTLRVMAIDNGRIEDIETNAFTKWYEEKTNVHIEWEFVPTNQAKEKLNLVLASGDYPDLIMKFDVSPSQLMVYGEQGIFLTLNDLIDKQGTEIKQVFEANPLVKEALTAPNGKIYSLPMYAECDHCSMPQKMWINQTWLDKLGLQMPTTPDEFYNVLKAFKERDPNGNGKADEIPLAGVMQAGANGIEGFLTSAFVYYDKENNNRLIVKDGKIEPAFTQNGYKEAMKYIRKLYADGLLAPETFTQDVNQLKKLVENPGVAIVGAAPALAPSTIAQIGSESRRWLDLKAVPPLRGPEGVQVTPFKPLLQYFASGMIITSATKHPDVALRWSEGFYNEETMKLAQFGPENVAWRDAKPDEVGINGKPATWTRLQTFGNVQNEGWAQINPTYQSREFRLGESAVNPTENQEVILYDETMNKYYPYIPDPSELIPQLWFTEEQAAQIVELKTTINGYLDQMIARFATGDVKVDEGWDEYLKTLDGMNLKTYVDIYQQAYDAVKK